MFFAGQNPARKPGLDADSAELHACAFGILRTIIESRSLDSLNINESGVTTITPVESVPSGLLGRFLQLCQQNGLDAAEYFRHFCAAVREPLAGVDAKLVEIAIDTATLELMARCTDLTLVID